MGEGFKIQSLYRTYVRRGIIPSPSVHTRSQSIAYPAGYPTVSTSGHSLTGYHVGTFVRLITSYNRTILQTHGYVTYYRLHTIALYIYHKPSVCGYAVSISCGVICCIDSVAHDDRLVYYG